MADDRPTSAAPSQSATGSAPATRHSSLTEGESSQAAGEASQREADPAWRRPRSLRPGSNRPDSLIRTITTPNVGGGLPSPRKPLGPRRTSSKMAPHRGQEFSVDDAIPEVDAEAANLRPSKPVTGSLRRAPSTLRRRPTGSMRMAMVPASESEDADSHAAAGAPADQEIARTVSNEEAPMQEEEDTEEQQVENIAEEDEEDDDEDLSDAESFTLKDRQDAINETHPFGIRIWKPALYKKKRSVEKGAEGDIHSAPGGSVSRWLWLFNGAWTVLFGWWLALVAGAGSLLCHLFAFAPGCKEYGQVLWGLSRYLFYPFGKYVKLIQEEAYAHEDEGDGRSITEYEQWQNGDLEEGRLFFGPVRTLAGRHRSDEDSDEEAEETASLLGRNGGADSRKKAALTPKRRLFGRGQWNMGRVIFFIFFYGLLTPLLFLVSMICWLMVFSLPMGRVTLILFHHLRRHPLALEFHSDTTHTRGPGTVPSSILLCTYRAVGPNYWKYTIDGTNIFLFNLLGVVAFVIFDYWVLYVALGLEIAITNTILVFLLALFSIIPLAYFIGQAVASISAQSTMGVGAAINAFFSTIVEVFLYCVALREGKAQLVEGSIIGSIFAGILLLPGISMCFGAIKRKTQRFNVKSAGVTSTMLLFAMLGAFGPTLFYQIYGSHELNCTQCTVEDKGLMDRDCRRCYYAQIPLLNDPFYINAVRPYTWFAALLLFLSYVIGLLFTLRTHAATIWNTELEEKKAQDAFQHRAAIAHMNTGSKRASIDYGTVNGTTTGSSHGPGRGTLARQNTSATLSRADIRESQLYKRILGQSLKQAGLPAAGTDGNELKKATTLDGTVSSQLAPTSPISRAQSPTQKRIPSLQVHGLSDEDNQTIVRQMAEMAATAAAVAARDATAAPRKTSAMSRTVSSSHHDHPHPPSFSHQASGAAAPQAEAEEVAVADAIAPSGGHDAPNWSRTKSYVVLLSATVAYAVIAEILVSTVDAVLVNSDIDEKFLGITLFALVPNTTEFLNAISFAMNGNIALSMEIGSAYALQVCLLQIPALVLFSAVSGRFIDPQDVMDHTFSLIFPQWDMVTVILCVFLLSYMYGEGKSNYFKGSILILSYLVVVVGFYLSGYNDIHVPDPNGPGQGQMTRFRMMRGMHQGVVI